MKVICKTLLIIFVFGTAKLSFSQEKSAAAYYAEGLAFEANLNRAQASRAFNKARFAEPTNATYVLAFGKSIEKLELRLDAIDLFDEAIKLNPNFAEAYIARAELFKFWRNFTKARADYQKAVDIFATQKDQTSRRKENIYKQELNNIKKRKDDFQNPPKRDRYYNLKFCRIAIFLDEEWKTVSNKQLYWIANNTQFNPQKNTDQYTTRDHPRSGPSRFQAESYFLEANAVEYYLKKLTLNKPKEALLDSIAFYINKKTYQNFYTAAILFKHAQNPPNWFSQDDLLKYCSETRKNALIKILPFIGEIGLDPINYHEKLANFPGIDHRWTDYKAPEVVQKPRVIYFDDSSIQNANCEKKKTFIGQKYKKIARHSEFDETYYILNYDCVRDKFLVFVLPGPSKKTMHIKDLNIGYKHVGSFTGTYEVCETCKGVGNLGTYQTVNDTYAKSGDSYVKTGFKRHTNLIVCQTCKGQRYLHYEK